MTRPPYRLLLLNPPAPRPVFRDCYCSGPAKGLLLAHPLDLQLQSGFFYQHPVGQVANLSAMIEDQPDGRFELEFIDAVFARLTVEQTLAQIQAFAPDVILALVGAASLESDAAFFRQVKLALPAVRLFFSGDLARFAPETLWSAIPVADGLLRDFSSPALRNYLIGIGSCENLPLRLPSLQGGGEASSPPRVGEGPGERFAPPLCVGEGPGERFPLPWPGFVQKYAYRLPFFSHPRYYSILASFGCPYACRYCNAHRSGYRQRDIASFLQELRFAATLGFKSLYIRDATFLVNKSRSLNLLQAWAETRLRFEWICFTRPELLDDELITWAARLGCRLMMLGVESSDEQWLRDMGRDTDLSAVQDTFRQLRRAGIRTAAQIMVGMDDATGLAGPAYERQLLRFLAELDPDYVSLNVFFRRPGLVVDHPRLTQVEARRDDYTALAARVNRAFYFRPCTLVRQLGLAGNPRQLALLLRIAAHLIHP